RHRFTHIPDSPHHARRARPQTTRHGSARQIPEWLPLAVAALGIGILGVRFLTVPVDGPSAAFAAGVLGITAIFVILTLRGSAQRRRRRRLITAHPGRLVVP